jgi:hypothetical protein
MPGTYTVTVVFAFKETGEPTTKWITFTTPITATKLSDAYNQVLALLNTFKTDKPGNIRIVTLTIEQTA